jgi:hypothetical protein
MYAPQLEPMLKAILDEGAAEPSVVIEELRLREAQQGLQNLADLVKACGRNEAIVIWPFPPHISQHLFPQLTGNEIFFADAHRLPPHLWHIDATPIRNMLQSDFDRLKSVRSVAVEIYRVGNELQVRHDAARFLETLASQNPELVIYAHYIDHLPYHERFVQFHGDVDIRAIY